ncbi:MAG: potassium/proton antiporter [Elusimicrobia bacterium]|nr:potassium/proton antiporter [Elusimicrobiota bacterium]
MLAGVDGPGGFDFDNAVIAQAVGVMALVCILFAGGLDTDWLSTRPVLGEGFSLATGGVVLTAAVMAAGSVWVLNFSWKEGFLLGAIVSSTDAAGVFAILRSQRTSLKNRLRPLLELESGSNDPMAVFLTVLMISLLEGKGGGWTEWVLSFARQMSLGVVCGIGFARGALFLLNRLKLEFEGLYPVLTLALVLLGYGFCSFLGGNGFLAAYVMGLTMGRTPFSHRRTIQRFQDGVAWLMQIAMFLALGLLVYPTQLVPVAGKGLFLAGLLIFVARPFSVFILLSFSRLGIRERLMVAWVGLRGAAPIVLALFPLLAGLPNAQTLFHLVFFIVLASVLLQGTSIPWMARKLKVDEPLAPKRRYPLEFDPMDGTDADLVDYFVPYGEGVAGRTLVGLKMPKDSLVVLINRNERFFIPTGDTVLEEGDVLQVLVNANNLPAVRKILTGQA